MADYGCLLVSLSAVFCSPTYHRLSSLSLPFAIIDSLLLARMPFRSSHHSVPAS